MKIAILTSGFLPVPCVDGGAVETLVTYLLEENEEKKYFDIDLYTIDSKKIKVSYKYTNIIKISRNKSFIAMYIYKVFNYFFRIVNINIYMDPFYKRVNDIFKHVDYDYVIIENNMYLYQYIFKKNKSRNIKYIYHLHNDIGGQDKPEDLCNLIADTAFKVICVSCFLKERFKFITNRETDVLYNVIDNENFSKINEIKSNEYLTKCNIKKDDYVFMYVGRIQKEKGVYELIKAFRELENKYSDIKLIIIGEIWYGKKNKSNYLKQILKLAEKSEKIVLLGGISYNDMPSVLNIADTIVIPTICEEAFGMVVIESMFSKKSLIISDSGGMPELVPESVQIANRKDFVNQLTDCMNNSFVKGKKHAKQEGRNLYDYFNSNLKLYKEEYLLNLFNIINGHEEK